MSEARVRFKATRPEFRRAGHLFGSAAWTEFDPEALGEEAYLRLVAEPILQVEFRSHAEAPWEAITAEQRAMATDFLRLPTASASEVDQSEVGSLDLVAQYREVNERLQDDLAELRKSHAEEIDRLKADHAAEIEVLKTDLVRATADAAAGQTDTSPENGATSGDAGGAEAPPADPAADLGGEARAEAKPKPKPKDNPARKS